MKKHFTILAVFILTFTHFSAAYLTGEETGPVTYVSASPETLFINVPFTLTFIIDHPVTEEVDLIAPQFPGSLTIDRYAKFARLSDARIQTVIEYRLIPRTAGYIIFESFAAVTPAGITETGSFYIYVQGNVTQQRFITPLLRWDVYPQQVTAGDRITLTLRAESGWNSSQPPPAFFMPVVPPGVILSAQTVSAAERTGGIVFKLLLIPLSPGDFTLPARILEHENIRFEIPALHIRIMERN